MIDKVPDLCDCICLDFETYYDGEVSIRGNSNYSYTRHPRFSAYLVAAYSNDIQFVGRPAEFDWSLVHDKVILAHNAGFDKAVFERLQELGTAPADVKPKGWLCTADMAAYLGCKRDLATACNYLLGEKKSKVVRANMRGKTYEDAAAGGFLDELLEYGLDDAKQCFRLYAKYRDEWPLQEQQASMEIRDQLDRGIYTDTAALNLGIETLRHLRDEALIQMPWTSGHDDAPLSTARIRKYGREVGVPVPASLAATNLDAQKWIDEYAGTHRWINAISNYRRTNTLLKKLENMRNATDGDGIFHASVKYFGAHTGRCSGAGGFNLQNMPRKEMFGVNMRHLLLPRPGHKLVIADYSQVEARYLLWLVGDTEFLSVLEQEGNLYQAYAKSVGWFSGDDLKKEDKPMYDRAKVTVLQLGYQSGAAKFRHVAEASYGVIFTEAEANKVVSEYRERNPKIVNHWREHHMWANMSARHRDETHEVELKSGRVLTYYDPILSGREIKMSPVRGVAPRKVYGGLLCLAGDTLVVTKRGCIRLDAIEPGDLVWDGDNWVAHGGLVDKGVKEVGSWLKIRLTADHRITDGSWWKSAICMEESDSLAALKWARGSVSSPSFGEVPGLSQGLLCGALAGESTKPRPEPCSGARLPVAASVDTAAEGGPGQSMTNGSRRRSSDPSGVTDTRASYPGAQIPGAQPTITTVAGASPCATSGSTTERSSSITSLPSTDGTNSGSISTESTTSGGTSPETCASAPASRATETADLRWESLGVAERVYDLFECGPNHRYMIMTPCGPVMVHNCENEVQASCRDILTDGRIAITKAHPEWHILFDCHDELVIEVPEAEAEAAVPVIADLMCNSSPWADGCPLEVEIDIEDHYKK